MKDWLTFEDIQGNIHYICRHFVAQISPNGMTGNMAATVIICSGGIQGIQVALSPEEVLEKLTATPI
jgi:hypothetical protein